MLTLRLGTRLKSLSTMSSFDKWISMKNEMILTCDRMKAWKSEDMWRTEASLDCSAKPVMITSTKSAKWEEASRGTGWQAPPVGQKAILEMLQEWVYDMSASL